MEKLTQERIELLNRLYNLSSDDNVIVAEINNRIASLGDQINSTEDSKKEHEQEKARIENDLAIFSEQSKEFINAFGKYTNSTFESLKSIDIDLELGTIVGKVKKSVPEREDYLNNLINNEKTSIMDCNNRLEELSRDEQRSKEELKNAISLKERLANLLEDILVNNNISSYTRGFIRRILNEFKAFNDDEVNELEFLILFPENGLRVYEDYKSNIGLENSTTYEIDSNDEEDDESTSTPNINEEEHIAPEIDPEKDGDEETKEEPVDEEPTEEVEETEEPEVETEVETEVEESVEEKVIVPEIPIQEDENENEEAEEVTEAESYDLPIVEEEEEAKEYVPEEQEPVVEEEPTEEVEEPAEIVAEPIPEEPKEPEKTPEELFIEELAANGINIENLEDVDKYELINKLKDKDMTLLKNNYQLLESINYPDTFIVTDNMYIYDKELSNKITILRSKGLNDKVINTLLINDELEMSYQELKEKIELLSSKEEINENNIYLINHNLATYYNNIESLNNIGIELDNKETRNYMTVLEKCNNLEELISIFTTYLLNLSKNNGKYALNILLSNPKELLFNIDDLLEKGLEEQIGETPEIFDYNIDTVLNRIKYCIDNNIPVYDEDDNTINSYIIDAREFNKEYPNANINELITREYANTRLKGFLNNDYANKLIDTLDNYYKNTNQYTDIELEDNDKQLFERISAFAESNMNINAVGKCTNKLQDIYISRNKFERNLSILIQELNKVNEISEDKNKITILVSALYNLREENLEDVVNTTLN